MIDQQHDRCIQPLALQGRQGLEIGRLDRTGGANWIGGLAAFLGVEGCGGFCGHDPEGTFSF